VSIRDFCQKHFKILPTPDLLTVYRFHISAVSIILKYMKAIGFIFKQCMNWWNVHFECNANSLDESFCQNAWIYKL